MLKVAVVCAAVAIAVADAALEDVPSFAVPSFDYNSLQEGDAPSRMLRALESGGIIALKNIPNYSNVRERFLASAVRCAVSSENTDEGVRYLSTKEFHDGTRRLTLRAAAGRELMDTDSDSLNAMAANCPGHRELYEEFSGTLERAVDTFASALDQTEFTMGDGERPISARKLIGDAKRLDHFHAYEAASSSSNTNHRSLSAEEIERDLSLAMHEDHGLFIAMAAPKFYSVNAHDGSIRERRLKSDASGLVIGATELDEIVRPELKDDEVVIMIGSGASRWLETSHHLPAVMHGMRMPEEMVSDDELTPGQRNLRAWFGKMTLMPSYQRLLESKMYFDEFTNRTTRHLMGGDSEKEDLKSIGCASGRHLVESEGSCTYSICTLKPGVEKPPTVGCNQACNYHTEFFDAKCEKKCNCTGTTTQADVCWMLCVARLPTSECALEDQGCSGLKMVCTADANVTTDAPGTGNHTHSTVTETPETTTATPLSSTPSPSLTNAAPVATSTPIPAATSETPIGTQEAPVETQAPATSSPTSEVPIATQGSSPETISPSTTTEAPFSSTSPSTQLPQPVTTIPSFATAAPDVTSTPIPVATSETPIGTQEAPVETQAPATSSPTSEVPIAMQGSNPATISPSTSTETPLPSVIETTAPTSATKSPTTAEPPADEPVLPGGYC